MCGTFQKDRTKTIKTVNIINVWSLFMEHHSLHILSQTTQHLSQLQVLALQTAECREQEAGELAAFICSGFRLRC